MLFAIGWLRTELNNGGFDQLFFNSAGDVVPQAVSAARNGGASELADLIERATVFLGADYPTDRGLRQDRLLALTDDENGQLEEMSREYLRIEASMDLDELMAHAGDA
jgi:hypothetical protein